MGNKNKCFSMIAIAPQLFNICTLVYNHKRFNKNRTYRSIQLPANLPGQFEATIIQYKKFKMLFFWHRGLGYDEYCIRYSWISKSKKIIIRQINITPNDMKRINISTFQEHISNIIAEDTTRIHRQYT